MFQRVFVAILFVGGLLGVLLWSGRWQQEREVAEVLERHPVAARVVREVAATQGKTLRDVATAPGLTPEGLELRLRQLETSRMTAGDVDSVLTPPEKPAP